jgi:hypothetical protein
MKEKTENKIPTHDPYTGELNPYYEELTGEKNPLEEDLEVDIVDLHRNDTLTNISLFIYETTIKSHENGGEPSDQIKRIKTLIQALLKNG